MPLKIDTTKEQARLIFEGVVSIDETDQLMEALKEYPDLCVDLSACEHLHTAPLQTLKILKVPVVALPEDPFWKFCLATGA